MDPYSYLNQQWWICLNGLLLTRTSATSIASKWVQIGTPVGTSTWSKTTGYLSPGSNRRVLSSPWEWPNLPTTGIWMWSSSSRQWIDQRIIGHRTSSGSLLLLITGSARTASTCWGPFTGDIRIRSSVRQRFDLLVEFFLQIVQVLVGSKKDRISFLTFPCRNTDDWNSR